MSETLGIASSPEQKIEMDSTNPLRSRKRCGKYLKPTIVLRRETDNSLPTREDCTRSLPSKTLCDVAVHGDFKPRFQHVETIVFA